MVDAEEAGNVANLAVMHNETYELFEIRTGLGLEHILRLEGASPEGTFDFALRNCRSVLR